MKYLYRFLLVLLICVAQSAHAAVLPATANLDISPAAQGPVSEAAPLIVWNRELAVFRAPLGKLSPKDRAESARKRIEELPDDTLPGEVKVSRITVGGKEGIVISVDRGLAFGLVREDLDPLSGETLDQAADRAAERFKEMLRARAEQRSLPLLLGGVGRSVAATGALFLVIWLGGRVRRRLLHRLKVSEAHRSRFRVFGLELHEFAFAVEERLIALFFWALWLTTAYLWLVYVFSQFPYTSPWGDTLGSYLSTEASNLASGAVGALPGVGAVFIIFIAARFLGRLLGSLFKGVETGASAVSWLMPESARATRRLVVIAVWIFAVVIAYPYIPGSQTLAFKGISIFLGLVVSLGSTGVMNQLMSGFIVLYSRAVRVGDFVRVNDMEGIVKELGMLSTKLATTRNEEISIPNAVLVSSMSTNFSKLSGRHGVVITASVSIGYDAPWRQVHDLLKLAAQRTAGVRKKPEPRVIQSELSDFSVEYSLRVNIDHPEEQDNVLSELHANIQDAFNEAGVQVMSPHFVMQPEQRVFVPKSDWHGAPTGAESASESGES